MPKRGIKTGYHTESVKVANLTASVASTKDGWTRHNKLDTRQAKRVSRLYNDLSTLLATYGKLAQKDISAFEQLGVKIETEDKADSR